MTKKLPNFITKEEFEKLFEAVRKKEQKAKSNSWKTTLRKYRLAMLLAFESGLRISEIVGYKGKSRRKEKVNGNPTDKVIVKDVNIPPLMSDMIDNVSLKVVSGKGRRDRIVPRPKRLNSAAVKMLPLKIPRRSLQGFVTRLGKKVLGKHITFHSLRHGFLTHLAAKGRPLHEIQMLAGHSRLDTTGIYLHCNPEEAIKGARDVF